MAAGERERLYGERTRAVHHAMAWLKA